MEAPPRQASDLQLLEHHNEAHELVIWDALSGKMAEIAPQIEGERVFQGWVPNPNIVDGALGQPSP